MLRKLLLAIALAVATCSVASAQNSNCPDVPIGDSSNRCANTRFVHNSVGVSPGNPTAQVGNTVVNGTAATFMRSDAAPPLAAGAAAANIGTLGGDLSGTLPNPTVAKIGGSSISLAGASTNDVLYYNGTSWLHNAILTLLNTVCSTSATRPTCVTLFGYATPMWWGATGNGVADDTTAVNGAMGAGCQTSASGQQVPVYFDRLYGISSTITVSQACAANGFIMGGTSFRRAGLVALAGLGSTPMVSFAGNVSPNVIQGVYIHDIFFNCSGVATSALLLTDVDDSEVSRNVMIACRSHNIDAAGIDGLHVTFRQNRFSQSSILGSPAAIYLEAGTNYLAEQNYFGGTNIGLRAAADTVASFRNIYEGNTTAILFEGGSQLSLDDYFNVVTNKIQISSNNPVTISAARGLVYTDVTYPVGFSDKNIHISLETDGTPGTPTTCGTGPTSGGTSLRGTVVTGSGATACTVPLGITFQKKLYCTVLDEAGGSTPPTDTSSLTSIVMSSVTAGHTYLWQCQGY